MCENIKNHLTNFGQCATISDCVGLVREFLRAKKQDLFFFDADHAAVVRIHGAAVNFFGFFRIFFRYPAKNKKARPRAAILQKGVNLDAYF